MASVRNDLNPFFRPRHIAIIGVTRSEFSFGGMSFLQKLQEANFPGTLYCINPKATEIRGLPAYPNLSSLPLVPDLAMVCVARHTYQLFWRNAAGSAYGTFIS